MLVKTIGGCGPLIMHMYALNISCLVHDHFAVTVDSPKNPPKTPPKRVFIVPRRVCV